MEVRGDTIPLNEAIDSLAPKGFQNIDIYKGFTYHKANTVIVVPMRSATMHVRFHQHLSALIAPPNQQRGCLFAIGDEVGHAYNNMIAGILNDPVMSQWEYVLTIEDDTLVPPDAHIRLIETMQSGNYDAVGGLYWTKGEVQMPMCYGDPEEYRRYGKVDFKPRDIREAVKNGMVVPCQGLAMGCTLWKMSLFREIQYPWFVTVADYSPSKGAEGFSQDLYFCRNAVLSGKSFAVDCRVQAGHIDWNSGIVY